MLNKVVEYIVVEADRADDIEALVNRNIKQGYVPSGSLMAHDNHLLQAMLKFG